MNKKIIRIVAIILAFIMAASVLVGVLASVASAAPSQAALDALRKQREGIKQEMQEVQSKINSLEYDQSVTTAKKEVLDERVALTQQEIENVTEQIAVYENLISEKQTEIEELERQEAEQWDLYKVRIRAMEQNGTISYYAIIFGASSFADMLSRIDTVNDIMEYDEYVYNRLLQAEEATRQAKADLEETKKEQEDKRMELDELKVQLAVQVEEATQLLEELKNNIEEAEAYYAEMEKENQRIYKEIVQMEEELRKIEEAKKRNAVKGTGTFAWPAKIAGHVTSKYGWRIHPLTGTKKFHNGIDIGGLGYGADILAADGGTVTTSEYSSSYGNYVVISHGNGYSTLYAHMSKRVVSKGDTVKKGDLIGYVGSTGNSNGPHLHFEVFYNGSRQDPLKYFSGVKVDDDA